jgi:hypothetical protein
MSVIRQSNGQETTCLLRQLLLNRKTENGRNKDKIFLFDDLETHCRCLGNVLLRMKDSLFFPYWLFVDIVKK